MKYNNTYISLLYPVFKILFEVKKDCNTLAVLFCETKTTGSAGSSKKL